MAFVVLVVLCALGVLLCTLGWVNDCQRFDLFVGC